MRGLGVALTAAAMLAAALASPTSGQAQDAKKTEAELKALKTEIDKVASQVREDKAAKDRLSRELRTAEMSASQVRRALDDLREERADNARKRAALAEDKRKRQADLAKERESLAGQLRAAYLIGSEEPLKLLLNQKDPSRAGRMFAYYSYFGRARRADRADHRQSRRDRPPRPRHGSDRRAPGSDRDRAQVRAR